jgi:streptogramin lyase
MGEAARTRIATRDASSEVGGADPMARFHQLSIAFSTAAIVLLAGMASAIAQSVSEFPTSASSPLGIVSGPDGNLWFTEQTGQKIGKITPAGVVAAEFALSPGRDPSGIVVGSDGALWFTEIAGNRIGRITVAGAISEFAVPTAGGSPHAIAAGADGALWFPETGANKIGRITTDVAITEFALPAAGSQPFDIAPGSDGNLWFVEQAVNRIGQITPAGAITEFAVPTVNATPKEIAPGPDGNLWFTENTANQIGRITPSGSITEFKIPTANSGPRGIIAGPDGNMWFVESAANQIARITLAGAVTEFAIPTVNSSTKLITVGPDGNLWFAEQGANKIGRITVPASATPLLAAVLPLSRSVSVGATATAFATVINTGATPAFGCKILPVTSLPASFAYQTTDRSTNALTGFSNTAVDIIAGGSQSFVIGFTANAAFVPTDVTFNFSCVGIGAAPATAGLNTLLLSASAAPVPDIVTLAATTQNDGILHIGGPAGSGIFAVATVNLGTSDGILVTVDTGSATLPVGLTLCQTNPATGVRLQAAGSAVTTGIGSNATPTFGIFATASGTIPFAPGKS